MLGRIDMTLKSMSGGTDLQDGENAAVLGSRGFMLVMQIIPAIVGFRAAQLAKASDDYMRSLEPGLARVVQRAHREDIHRVEDYDRAELAVRLGVGVEAILRFYKPGENCCYFAWYLGCSPTGVFMIGNVDRD